MGKVGKYARLGWTVLLVVGCAIFDEEELADQALVATLVESARIAERSFDHETAVSHYQRLFERDPKNLDAAIGLARNLRISGAARNAIRVVRSAIEVHGNRPELVFELGKAQLAASLLNDARDSLTRARQDMPTSWQVRSALGVLYDRLGNFEDAEAAYRSALAIAPNNATVLNNLALSFAQAGRIDEALALLERVVGGERPTLQARQNLALLHAIKGDFATAERLAREDLPPEIAADTIAAFRRLIE